MIDQILMEEISRDWRAMNKKEQMQESADSAELAGHTWDGDIDDAALEQHAGVMNIVPAAL
jgi:hypothetical protein